MHPSFHCTIDRHCLLLPIAPRLFYLRDTTSTLPWGQAGGKPGIIPPAPAEHTGQMLVSLLLQPQGARVPLPGARCVEEAGLEQRSRWVAAGRL